MDGDRSGGGGNEVGFAGSSRPLVLGRDSDLLLCRDALRLLVFGSFPVEHLGSSEPWYSEELVRET